MTTTQGDRPGTVAIPELDVPVQRSPFPDLDAAVAAVAARKDAWAALDVVSRVALLERLIRDTRTVADRWVETECARKRIPVDQPVAGEEWFAGPSFVIRNLRLLRDALRGLARNGRPRLPGRVRTLPNGQVAAPVFPTGGYDRLLYPGITGEVWMQPGVTVDEVLATAGGVYRSLGPRTGSVGVVLGAGNISSISANDVLYKLFAEDQVVVIKLSPLTEALGPVLAAAFAALVEAGFLRIVYGGAAEAEHLVRHPLVDAVHMTGSDKTHDAIVFGQGDDGRRRKAAGTPLLTRQVTSELGNVTPLVVVPGPWSAADIRYQAEHIATSIAHNGGFNCVATRLLVVDRRWDLRDDLLAAVREVLRRIPNRYAYYPGAQERFTAFVDAHPRTERLGAGEPGTLPWALLAGVDPDAAEDVCTVDPFAPVASEVVLDAGSPAEFLDRAVEFCNERVWGTLAATVVVHPGSIRDREGRAAVQRAVADLRYGAVVFNTWCALAFGLVSPPWGAFPGNEPSDIGSGRGVVHNTYLFARPEKSVLHTPFRARPKPPFFVTNRRQRELLAANTDFEATQDPRVLPALFYAALRG